MVVEFVIQLSYPSEYNTVLWFPLMIFCLQSQMTYLMPSIFPALSPLCKLIYGLITGQASRYEGTQITGPYQMAEKRHGIIENLEVDQYLEAQGYTEYDNTINMEI